MFNLLNGRFRPATRLPLRRPRLEALEDRLTPAGVVNVTFQNGALALVGDAQDNSLKITQEANGRLTLLGTEGTTLFLNGQQVDVNGVTLDAVLTGALTANLGAGRDHLDFSGEVFDVELQSLNVNLGGGADVLTLQDGVSVSGDMVVNGGAGYDTLEVRDEVTVKGALTVLNGAGGSLLNGKDLTELTVGGVFTLHSGAGYDEVRLHASQAISLGGFVQTTGAGNHGSDTQLSPAAVLTINGDVVIVNGAGNDRLTIGDGATNTQIAGNTTINQGASKGAVGNVAEVHGNIISLGGSLTVIGGSGKDRFWIEAGLGGQIVGAVKAVLGKGPNSFEAKVHTGLSLTLNESLVVNSKGKATVALADVKVLGASAIVTGNGADLVFLDDVTLGQLTVNTKGGADSVFIETDLAYAGESVFNEAVLITTGAGKDLVRVSGDVKETVSTFLAAVTFDGGMGADTLELSPNASFNGPAPVKKGF